MKALALATACVLVLVPATIKIARVQTAQPAAPAQEDAAPGALPGTAQDGNAIQALTGSTVLESPQAWRQGQEVLLTVESQENLASISLYVSGERTRVGGRSRGRFVEVITNPQTPENDPVTGVRRLSVNYTVPWFDAASFELVAKGFDSTGRMAVKKQQTVSFVPKDVPGDLSDGVVVSKSDQRLYRVKEGRVARVYLVSTGRTHRDGGGPTPTMTTRIQNKSLNAHSRKYDVDMRYWNAITSDGRYGIHATYRNLYRKLGRADSHGCVRLHLADARIFYKDAPVGTPVYVVQ